jgi:hypothetical protein
LRPSGRVACDVFGSASDPGRFARIGRDPGVVLAWGVDGLDGAMPESSGANF